jgi:hypothetical protein
MVRTSQSGVRGIPLIAKSAMSGTSGDTQFFEIRDTGGNVIEVCKEP